MIPRKLKVCFAAFPYGGNGATASEHPDVRTWLVRTVPKAKVDDRVEEVHVADYSDTPVTMTRNMAVANALQAGVDVLVMIDSDMRPDKYVPGMYRDEVADPKAVPFWDAAFNFLYDRYERGPVCVAAPYGGPPQYMENVYVFQWASFRSGGHDPAFKLAQYTREQAAGMEGIHECAALPTGLSMFDTRVFKLTEPEPPDFEKRVAAILREYGPELPQRTEEAAERIARERYRAEQSWFYYEWSDHLQAQKDSTEDVTATRDISQIGLTKLGYNPVHCAWSSWAGHWKPWCVGKPIVMTPADVNEKLTRAAQSSRDENYSQIELRTERYERRSLLGDGDGIRFQGPEPCDVIQGTGLASHQSIVQTAGDNHDG